MGFENVEATVQIDDVRYRSDGAAEHFFFQRGGDTYGFHGFFQTEAVVEDIFQLIAEIVVCHRGGIVTALADHLISVCHAGAPQRAEQVLQQVKERFAFADTEILELSPGLTTHGGPGCIVIQAICK